MKSSRVAPFEPRHPKHLFLGSFLNPAYIVEDGQKILKDGSNLDDIVKTAPKLLFELTSPAMLAASVIPGVVNMFGAPANAATVPTQATVAPKPQEEKKDDGGWFGKAMSFGGSLVDKAKAAGTSAMNNSVKAVGDSVAKTASDAWNGASKWVSHKAEIAIGVGVVALVAATILTGGAALAVAGAMAGTGAAVGAGTAVKASE